MPFSGFDQLNPQFATSLQDYISAVGGVEPFSGFRSTQRQAQLYGAALQKYGSPEAARKWVAPPGHSQHNFGEAVDLHFADDAARQRAHAMAGQYGLTFPLANEPWHIEPIGARAATAGSSQGGLGINMNTPAATVGGADYTGAPMPWERFSEPGFFPPAMAAPEPPPMTPERFLMGMIGGQNPLRQMVFSKLSSLFT